MSTENEAVFELVRWWEKRRWIYNVIVGIVGVISVWLFCGHIFGAYLAAFILNIILFGAIANFFYTLGWALPIFFRRNSRNTLGMGRDKLILFAVGTILTVVVVVYYSLMTGLMNH